MVMIIHFYPNWNLSQEINVVSDCSIPFDVWLGQVQKVRLSLFVVVYGNLFVIFLP